MKPRFRELLERCISDGLVRGWNRAHKHTDTPCEERIRDEQYDAIMLELHEWFEFEENE